MISLCWNQPILPVSQYSPLFIQAHYHLMIRLSWLIIYACIKIGFLFVGLFCSVYRKCTLDSLASWAFLYSILALISIVY